jgi:hypothetical protein
MERRSSALAVAAVSVSLLLLAAGASIAGPCDHEDGLLLRLSVGVGNASTETKAVLDEQGGDVGTFKFDGTTGDFNIAIGKVLRPNLAVHATVYGWVISDPEVTRGPDNGSISANLDLSAYGVGVTYYMMPANVYFSPSVGMGSLTLSSSGVSVESDYGLMVDFTAGKEWWVSENWAVGVAGGATYHSIPDNSAEENWTGLSYAVRFTATMN